jgi:uncharacterized UPF0160 family protein
MAVAAEEWAYQVKHLVLFWYPARPIVVNALKNRLDLHPSGKIMKLDSMCPWKDHLYELEEEMGIKNEILFVLFEGQDDWRV